jgi:coenzyme F420 biosynthesis associated uncharacterized protein
MDRRTLRDDRVWQAGFLVGSAVGAAVTVLGRHAERAARRGGLVDWSTAERVAVRRAAAAPGTLSRAELAAAEPAYIEALARIRPAFAKELGVDLPLMVERAGVVDRAGWVHANVSTFQSLIRSLEGELLDELIPVGAGLPRASMALANRWLTTRQIGFVLGFLGTRVLGQYDIALLAAESDAPDGRLLFVEENIRMTGRGLGVPLGPFRTWIALHEATHAFEFEAHPWLRPYLSDRLERQLAGFSRGAASVGREAMAGVGRVIRGEGGDHWMERFMAPEQRRLFRETQAVMSLLEGFADHVMDRLGAELVPDVAAISARFHERRERKTPFERAIMRLTGMDLKMEQYKAGERFVAAIAKRGGPEALRRLWEGPETLPTPEEIARPASWLERVMER